MAHIDTDIDILLTDIELPDGTGTELATVFGQRAPDPAVVFITGAAPAKYLAQMGDGAQLVTKPFTTKQLLQALRSQLPAD